MDLAQITCPQCGKTGPLKPAMVGRRVRCPTCRTGFLVTEPEPKPEPFAFPPIREKLLPLRERLNDPFLWNVAGQLVPLGARATLLGCLFALAAWVYASPPYLLMAVCAAWAYRQRNRLNFGGIFGSARFETLPALESARMIGRDGLLLGRHQEDDFRRSRAVFRLLTRSWAESDGVCRHFLTALTGRRLDFMKGAKGPLLCVPKGDYCHLATIAPTGAGKGVNTVIPNLLNYPHSAIVVDIKGENYAKTAAYRQSLGHRIVVLDPCGITDAISATLDPLGLIDARSPTVIEDVKSLADAMVVKTAQDHDPYWNETSVTILTAVMLLVVTQGADNERNLNHVRQILTDREAFEAALGVMAESPDLGGMLVRYGKQVAAIPEKERNSALSSVNRHSNFLDSQLVAASVASTSFDIRSIATRPTTVYLVLPSQHLQSLSRLMRMWINALLFVVKQAGASEKHEVLFILDEVAQLGEMRPIEEAITLLRGFGLRVWLILQSLGQLESCYGKARARTMLGNCQTQQWFGVGDYESAEYISKFMGDTTVISPSHQEGNSSSSGSGPGSSSSGSNRGWSFGAAARKLAQPEEILRMHDSVFVLHKGHFPILGSKIRYYADPEFDEATGGEATAPRSVSRVSAVLCAVGLLLALYTAKGQLAVAMTHRPAIQAEATPEERQTLLTASNPDTGNTLPSPLPQPREAIVTDCPFCGKRGQVPPDYRGQELVCSCGQSFTVTLP